MGIVRSVFHVNNNTTIRIMKNTRVWSVEHNYIITILWNLRTNDIRTLINYKVLVATEVILCLLIEDKNKYFYHNN